MPDTAPLTPEPFERGAAVRLPQVARRPQRGLLGRMAFALRRRIWIVALAVALGFLATALWTALTPPRYTAVAVLQIEAGDDPASTPTADSTAALETEATLLRAPNLGGRVVDALGLASVPEFIATVRAPSPDPDVQARTLREAAIAALRERTQVRRVGRSLVLRVGVSTSDPELSTAIANALVEEHLRLQLDTRYERLAGANTMLAERVTSLRQDLADKERAVEDYRAQSEILTQQGAMMAQEAVAQISRELAQARAELSQAQARQRSGGTSEPVAAPGPSSSVAALERERADLATRYGPRHPQMLDVERRLAVARAGGTPAGGAGAGQGAGSLRSQIQTTEQRIAGLEAALSRQRAAVVGASVSGAELAELERAAAAARQMHDTLVMQMNQAAGAATIDTVSSFIATPATPPRRASIPDPVRNLLLGLGLGTGIGLALAALMALMDRTLRGTEETTRRLGVPGLAALPKLGPAELTLNGTEVRVEDYVLQRPMSAYAEGLRAIRTALRRSGDVPVRVIAVTSALPGDGKTVTAVGLARLSALSGLKTILVDCDLRRASASEALGLGGKVGLVETLERDIPYDQAIQKDPHSALDVLPLAGPEATARDLFSGGPMRHLLDSLRLRYDMVILDTAPVLPIADTRQLAPLADTTLIVARWGKTPVDAVREAIGMLDAAGAKVGGATLTAVSYGVFDRLVYDTADEHDALFKRYYVQ